jgi:hypothetical protein
MRIAGQSTKVDERNASAMRMPSYGFESRLRYFAMTLGTRHAIAIGIGAISAHALRPLTLHLSPQPQSSTQILLYVYSRGVAAY